jgi:hypothetical protein
LKEALTIQIQQSPYLNATAARGVEDRVVLTVPEAGRSKAAWPETLSTTADERADRVGSIAPRADRYVVESEAQNCTQEKPSRRASAGRRRARDCARPSEWPPTRFSAKLGRVAASHGQFNVPVEDATTSSLDALRSYVWHGPRAKGARPRAIPFFTHALELDRGCAR